MARKIGAVLILCLLTALCAVQAFAVDESNFVDTYFVISDGYYYNNRFTVVHTDLMTLSPAKPSFAFPSGLRSGEYYYINISFSSVYGTANHDQFLSDYTYYFTIELSNTYLSSNPPPVTDYPKFSSNIFYLGHSPFHNNSSSYKNFPSVVDSSEPDRFWYDITWDYGEYTQIDTSWVRSDIYLVAFRFDSMTPSDVYDSVALKLGPDFLVPAGDVSFNLNISLTSCACYYDPTGDIYEDIIDSDADRIIEGQREAIAEGQENEYNKTQDNASGASDEAQEAASSAFNFSGFSSALSGLVSALGYTGTDFHFYLEAADNIPFIGSLWGTQEIPLKTMIDALPQGLLYVLRFLAWLALLFSVVHIIKSLINDINGGGED